MKRMLTLAPALVLLIAFPPKFIGILGAVVMIGSLIFLHEFGHFLAAKWMGMPVSEFALGLPFGPFLRLFTWKETAVGIRPCAPLGGYVKLAGYNPEEPNAEDPYGFLQQPFGKRVLFYSGGILANLATAFVLLYCVSVNQVRYPQPPIQVRVMAGSAAEAGGLQSGDELKHVGPLALPEADWNEEVVPYIQRNPGKPIPVDVQRKGERVQLTLTPASDGKVGRLGIVPVPGSQELPPRPLRISDFGKGLRTSVPGTFSLTLNVIKGYGRLFTGGVHLKELGGPITIARVGSEAAQAGWIAFLFTCALISINLAVLNALPIPFLDGGHMAILVFEKIRRKDLSIALKERILTGGLVFLATLMVLVLVLDVLKLKH